ncbi:MAG: protein adenylyltransferase SelO family protein [Oleiphilaceae bacterium]|nr:protein adenylyltransferase SelO family protein [Oleiphilaceae bacterium]
MLNELSPDPQSNEDGQDHRPRQVFSGHYVRVTPTPIATPKYITHSPSFFEELGFDESFAHTEDFHRLFSGDASHLPAPMKSYGWATGYALSIYGTEYTQQCPFRTGNGYGDGRALSVVEAELNGKRWEFQLKGSGRTPYSRGADGRAVLRSSVREFLAQEHMHALGVATSRSLSLFVSETEVVERPWYLPESDSIDPEILVDNPVAISTRVAPSFLRVGQIELFARRARSDAHPNAHKELKQIVEHLIRREYIAEIDTTLPFDEQLALLVEAFRDRLISLVCNWLRVGYCQGNFNSDNCAAGGFTLDYGPFGFCERFEQRFQPWTGGGEHFSFFNQPNAVQVNFESFCSALSPLLDADSPANTVIEQLRTEFFDKMRAELNQMWASKLGLESVEPSLVMQLIRLMELTPVDYTLFFRELSNIPEDSSALHKSFYSEPANSLMDEWNLWFDQWKAALSASAKEPSQIAQEMKQVNPKYIWREWLIVPAYQQAEAGDYSLIHELQEILSNPYDEQSKEIEDKYYQLRPREYFHAGGVSHYSCSS